MAGKKHKFFSWFIVCLIAGTFLAFIITCVCPFVDKVEQEVKQLNDYEDIAWTVKSQLWRATSEDEDHYGIVVQSDEGGKHEFWLDSDVPAPDNGDVIYVTFARDHDYTRYDFSEGPYLITEWRSSEVTVS